MESKGIFYTMRIQDAKKIQHKEGLKIFGVRIKKFLPDGFVHWNGLTPPASLLFQMKDLEKEGNYNEKVFKEIYRPAFLKNLKGNKIAEREFETILKTLEEGKNVYYACYCGNSETCHRSILEGMVKKKGYICQKIE